MKLEPTIIETILKAESKALATRSDTDINVVPVSTVEIINNQIILVNYFMNKTLDNILNNPHIALCCWKGTTGIQVKGSVNYQTAGGIFDQMKQKIAQVFPERTVQGVIIIEPQSVFDISLAT